MTSAIANSNPFTSHSTRPSGSSPSFQMPHVFVIPPEEEQPDNPPWCCFDADEQPENTIADFPSNHDIYFLDAPYRLQQSENDVPVPHSRTSVYHPRPRLSASKKLEKKQRPEAIKIIENKPSRVKQRDAREDSDVIEVVKVKRSREVLTDVEENAKVKRSKTLRARATKALRSIKNVGKASHRTHIKELWSSTESMPGIFKGMQEQIRSQQAQEEDCASATPPKKGSLSRASSRSLSQIFQPPKSSRVESLFTVRVAPSVVPTETETHHTHPAANPLSLPHLEYDNMNSLLNEAQSILATSDALHRPVSQIPATKKSSNTKFSVRDLHRLFSFSSSSLDGSSPPTTSAIPSSPVRSRSKLSISTLPLSCDYPEVPMEEDIYTDAYFVDLESPERRLASQYRQGYHTYCGDGTSTRRRLSDPSFEMRLDSLHFDTLSFDPEDFDFSRERIDLR